ncbi:thiopurine S-methyltransferase [Ottowia sp.]|uniref:thiopurine S-methyltransferase n=1 Tax=Ottowia sp. TaxID=1898956 RepID=UPI002BFA42B0|nr:thiopurine S-methyltransferase [Ottowia sp.]
MEHDFWLQRWREGQTGFHQARVLPLLQKHWPALGVAPGGRVFVPLAGKSLDMLWLAEQGHRVLGVELSPLAVEQFFAEHHLTPAVHASRYGTHHVAGPIELICGDAFGLDEAVLADCVGVYDRAALIALPPELRARYAGELQARLPAGCRGLLLTLEYPQQQMPGPPFSVAESEVVQRYAPAWQVQRLECRDILAQEPHFAARGLTALSTVVFRLERAAHSIRSHQA